MKGVDLLTSFELEINKINDTLQKPLTDDSLYWINQGIVKFTKDRFNGNAPKRTSYEQNEKRTRDLINLFKECTLEPTNLVTIYKGTDAFGNKVFEQINPSTHKSYEEYEYIYPDDMMYVLNEDVEISDLNGDHEMDTCVFECTADNFMYRINNKLTDFHYRFYRARPLRVRTKDGFRLLTDKKYKINKYTLGYLKVPEEITNEDPFKDYTDFEDHTWLEIIKIAAQMYIENQSDPRYKTITNEVLTQE